jgi:hypothetical protein
MMLSSMDGVLRKRAEAHQHLCASLVEIPGGHEVIDWFEGAPEFGDAEIISLALDRRGPSVLRITLDRHCRRAVFTFALSAWIDADMRGFSHQNVIAGLKLRRPEHREVQEWERGVGCKPGAWVIELEPCLGAYGTIRADIDRIIIE